MAEQRLDPNAAGYSSSQAPETQEAARKRREHDYRAIPGGDPSRATAALGMESLDRDTMPSTDYGLSRDGMREQPPSPPR